MSFAPNVTGNLPFLVYFFTVSPPSALAALAIDQVLTSTKVISNQNIIIEFGQKQHQFSLNLTDLLCVKAEGNYVEIYSLKDGLVNKKLIRSSLSKVKKQLELYSEIKHCHRSFIVNTEHLEKVTGNARNFNLHLDHLDFAIPVSRSFPIDTIK